MVTSDEIKQLYENDLKPQLEGMESQRKYIKKWRNLAITGAILTFILFQYAKTSGGWLTILAMLVLIIAAIYCAIKAFFRYQDYRKVFKNEVVTKIVKLINPDYSYKPSGHVPVAAYNQCGIFPPNPDRCTGDDLITGKIDKTPFQFSELKTQEKSESRDSSGNKSTEWTTIFRGVFFVADFNKHLSHITFVVPQNDKFTTNIFGKERKNAHRYGELIKLENPEFEQIFSVYGNNPQEARYILTPTLMEAVVNVQKKYQRKMYFSFTGENVYCAIPIAKNMFEPKIGSSGILYQDIEEMFLLLGLIETIITEMNLNTRIWTKN